MTEGLFLSQADSRPMYQQIMEQIKLRIAAGDWPAGSPLPSIRELAASTQVSVITIKRAYRELEQEGLVVTRQGRGSFVAEGTERGEVRNTELDRHLEQLMAAAERLGVDEEALRQRFEQALARRQSRSDD